MADDYTDDFMEDEEEGNGAGRPFMIIAGILLGIFLLTLMCIAAFAMTSRNGQQDLVAEIEMTNEAIASQNLLVTQTVAAMQTEAARPTDEPTATPTEIPPTPTVTATPTPTETPVVQPPNGDNGDNGDGNGDNGDGDGNGNGNGDGTGSGGSGEVTEGTRIFSGGGAGAGTPTPVATPPGGSTTLPETGLELWAIILGALGLMAVLFIVRQLRMANQ
jgi:uncharacterized membrane protein YgcG